MKQSRREFLKQLTLEGTKTFVFGSLICITTEFALTDKLLAISPKKKYKDPKTGQVKDLKVIYGFLVDTTKCIGCGSCVRADKAENDVPDGFFRTWVERYTFYENGEVFIDSPNGAYDGFGKAENKTTHEGQKAVRGYFVPKLCNHCIETPCIQVCPVGASFKTDEGVVLINQDVCVGCAYCVQACPFGTRYIDPRTGVADKCTWCYHRVTKGLNPACVEICPTHARIFGNISDPDTEISQILRTHRVQVLKSYLGTNPKTRYIGLDSEVI